MHLALWAAGLGFLAANIVLVVLLIRALRWRLRHPNRRASGGPCIAARSTTFLEASLAMTRPPCQPPTFNAGNSGARKRQ